MSAHGPENDLLKIGRSELAPTDPLAWPLLGLADWGDDAQPDLRFTAVTDGKRLSVHAFDDLIACASLRWMIVGYDEELGVIRYVYVGPEWRRKGVATSLLKAANAYAEHYKVPAPRHSDERTLEGDAWAQALGAEPATEIYSPADEHAQNGGE